ncbi:MAG TPA: hypothetical protein VF823_04630, partial [Anaerolineales bacterium]
MVYDLAIPSTYARSSRAGERLYRLLCNLLVGRSGEREWEQLDPTEWQALARIAQDEGVAPLIYCIFKDGGWLTTVPENIRIFLAQVYYQETAHSTLLFQELTRI